MAPTHSRNIPRAHVEKASIAYRGGSICLKYQDPESFDKFETLIVANPQFENCYCRDHVLFEFNSFHRMAQLLHINRPSANVCIAKSCNMGNGLVHHMTRCEYGCVHINI